LKHLETVKAISTNIGVVPETEFACQIMLHGCPLVSPPILQYGALTDTAHRNDQNAQKMPEDSLTTKNNPYFKGWLHHLGYLPHGVGSDNLERGCGESFDN